MVELRLKERVRELLDKEGWTIKELCDKIELSEAALYKIFGRKSIETKHLLRIAKAFNVPVLYFFDDLVRKKDGTIVNLGSSLRNQQMIESVCLDQTKKYQELKQEYIKLEQQVHQLSLTLSVYRTLKKALDQNYNIVRKQIKQMSLVEKKANEHIESLIDAIKEIDQEIKHTDFPDTRLKERLKNSKIEKY